MVTLICGFLYFWLTRGSEYSQQQYVSPEVHLSGSHMGSFLPSVWVIWVQIGAWVTDMSHRHTGTLFIPTFLWSLILCNALDPWCHFRRIKLGQQSDVISLTQFQLKSSASVTSDRVSFTGEMAAGGWAHPAGEICSMSFLWVLFPSLVLNTWDSPETYTLSTSPGSAISAGAGRPLLVAGLLCIGLHSLSINQVAW